MINILMAPVLWALRTLGYCVLTVLVIAYLGALLAAMPAVYYGLTWLNHRAWGVPPLSFEFRPVMEPGPDLGPYAAYINAIDIVMIAVTIVIVGSVHQAIKTWDPFPPRPFFDVLRGRPMERTVAR